MEIKRITIPFQRKAVTEAGAFEGYGSTFGNVDFGGDVVEKGAFLKSLNAWKSKDQLPLMPWYHNTNHPIGDWLEMYEDEKGLFVKGKLWVEGSKRIDSAVMAHNLITGTGPKGMSIGYVTNESEMVDMDGKRVRRLLDLDLMELSIVPFGMNDQAVVTSAKNLFKDETGELKDIRAFEKILREAGLSRTEAKALLAKGFSGVCRDDDSEDLAKKAEAETKKALQEILHSLKH